MSTEVQKTREELAAEKLFAEYMQTAAEGLNSKEFFDQFFAEYMNVFRDKSVFYTDAQKKIVWGYYRKAIIESGTTGTVAIPEISNEILNPKVEVPKVEPQKQDNCDTDDAEITLNTIVEAHKKHSITQSLNSQIEANFAWEYCKKNDHKDIKSDVLIAVKRAASCGLSILPYLKQADIITRYNKAKGRKVSAFEVRYQGIIDAATDEGVISHVYYSVIKENDIEISISAGSNPKITHIRAVKNPGQIIGVYCILHFPDGSQKPELMDSDDIVKFKNKFGTTEVWKDWEDRMLIKSVIKRAFNGVRSSMRLNSIFEADNATMIEAEEPKDKQTAENTL